MEARSQDISFKEIQLQFQVHQYRISQGTEVVLKMMILTIP